MFSLSSAPTPLDVNFRLFGFPVRVHPIFWVGTVLMAGREGDLFTILIWVAAVFVSILIHEMGHGLGFRRFKRHSHLVLHGMGGVCIPDEPLGWDYNAEDEKPWNHIQILFAGPLAGFLFAGLLIVGVTIWGKVRGVMPAYHFEFVWPEIIRQGVDIRFMADAGHYGWYAVSVLLSINIWWGLVNLLPVYPLDGGQISRELFGIYGSYRPIRDSLVLSLITAIAVACWAAYLENWYMAVLFGFIGIQNFMALQSEAGRSKGYS